MIFYRKRRRNKWGKVTILGPFVANEYEMQNKETLEKWHRVYPFQPGDEMFLYFNVGEDTEFHKNCVLMQKEQFTIKDKRDEKKLTDLKAQVDYLHFPPWPLVETLVWC